MSMSVSQPVLEAVRRFAIDGELASVKSFDRGHIHDSYLSAWDVGEETPRRYLHQRLNETVFQDLPGLMHNIERVIEHLDKKLTETDDREFRVLRLVPTTEGGNWVKGDSGAWRTYDFIENTRSHDVCDGPDEAFEAARAFGRFQFHLKDMDVGELRETIPNFFSSPFRLHQFEEALAADPDGRSGGVGAEIRFVRERMGMVDVIESHLRAGRFPMRIVHGDTKLNNVLFDNDAGRAVSVVDLDTCMAGWTLYDFGDLVRFTAATSTEDEQDLDQAGMNLELYRALVDGFLAGADATLTPLERKLMPFAARLVTFTVGLRFLTDHIAGDVYFKTSRPDHNLDRARVQFRMVERMEALEEQMGV